MPLNLTGWLLVACAVLSLSLAFAVQRVLSAGARCDTKIESAKLAAVEAERERATKADAAAAAMFADVQSEVRSSLDTAADATADRDAKIHTVYVTGECRMPAGLPPLSDAVKEARDAAAD